MPTSFGILLWWVLGAALGAVVAELVAAHRRQLEDELAARQWEDEQRQRADTMARLVETFLELEYQRRNLLDARERASALAEGQAQAATLRCQELIAESETQAAHQRALLAQMEKARGELQELRQELSRTEVAYATVQADLATLRASPVRKPTRSTPSRRRPTPTGMSVGDDLRRIEGVGPVLEKWLREQGISNYQQIASWSDEEVTQLGQKMPRLSARVWRDDWRRQAQRLYEEKYGTEGSRAST